MPVVGVFGWGCFEGGAVLGLMADGVVGVDWIDSGQFVGWSGRMGCAAWQRGRVVAVGLVAVGGEYGSSCHFVVACIVVVGAC